MNSLIQKIKIRQAKIGIIGLGYVGLPLVIRFCEENFCVSGFDIDQKKVERLNKGESYIKHVPSEKIKDLSDSKRFEATSDYSKLKDADCIVICVPTPLKKNKEPDLSYVENTTDEIAVYMRKGQLISLESTTYPGPGLGGHCIPIDPYYLSWKAKEYDFNTRFIELAGEVNTNMPDYVVYRINDALNKEGKCLKNSKILILGVAYKKDTDDIRESPGVEIINTLKDKGAKVDYNDPYIPSFSGMRHYPDLSMKSVELSENKLKKYNCVVIITNHSQYNYTWIVKNSRLVLDTRNATRKLRNSKIIKA